jgi:hypothetical protein
MPIIQILDDETPPNLIERKHPRKGKYSVYVHWKRCIIELDCMSGRVSFNEFVM